MRKLTPKQRAFVREYLRDHDGKHAAIRAGYSERGAKQTAHKLLKLPEIVLEIERGIQRTVARSECTVDDVISELVKIAFANMHDVAEWDESGLFVKSSREITRDQAASIAEVREDVDRFGRIRVSIRQHSKLTALAHIGKHLGMFSERLDEKIQDAVEEILSEIGGKLPAEVYTLVVEAIRDALDLPPVGGDDVEEDQRPVH